MKAIKTTYHGATNTRASRIIATDEDGNSITIPYNAAINAEEAHVQAAASFINHMGWGSRKFVTGALKNSYVHVFTSRQPVHQVGTFDGLISDLKHLVNCLRGKNKGQLSDIVTDMEKLIKLNEDIPF